ncbi:hypothetical protein ACS0TY_030169 [Phlomoides rotata]
MKISFSSSSTHKAIMLLLVSVILGGSCCWCSQVLVKREERRSVVSTEYGEISAASVVDHTIHFFTLDPNSLFLPVILHAHMLLYVHTGSGKLRWMEEDEVKSTDLRRGDVHRLEEGAIFFIHSNLDTHSDRQKLRIHAIFPNSHKYLHETGPYSSIRDMLLGFDNKVLQAAFKVPVDEIEELVNGTKPPAIIHGLSSSTTKNRAWEMEARFIENLVGSTTSNVFEINKKKKKKKDKDGTKLFNIFSADKDFENCNGWSTAVTGKKVPALRGTDIGLFMVNLTQGSMMGPHWNPTASEIAVVLQGRGMIRVVCHASTNETGCKDMRYKVEEGDTFVVPRFHAMAQMAFNNDTFVFMGFSTSANRNHPQYFAGRSSVLRTLDKDVLAMAFNVTNTTMDHLMNSQQDSVILGCISCAEEEFKFVEEEMEKERAAAREKEAEEARKREEEKRKEEEEDRKREEEEAARQEEERERQEEEEERKSQEEEAARQEEERKRREEEEEARKRGEEAARRAEEERKKKQEEEAREREAEEERKRREEEEEARKRGEEAARRAEEERKKRQEEEAREREAEEERKRQEEAAREREAEEERERQEEAAREREAEEERERQEEAARKRQEEEAREKGAEEEAAREREAEEAARKRQEDEAREKGAEEEAAREREAEEEAARKRQEEREEEEERKRQEEAAAGRREEEEGRKAEEEEERRRQEEAQREEEAPGSWRNGMKKRLIRLFPTTGHAHSPGRFGNHYRRD